MMIKGLAFDSHGKLVATAKADSGGMGSGGLHGTGSGSDNQKTGKEDEPRESNILVASWINDLGNNQKEFDVSFL